jgi:archaellum component FlaC
VDDETRAYFDEFRRAVSVEFGVIAARFDAVDARFDGVDARFDAVDQRFGAVDRRFDGVDQRMDRLKDRIESARRELGVLIEDVRGDVRAVAEQVVANTEAIDELRARLDAR